MKSYLPPFAAVLLTAFSGWYGLIFCAAIITIYLLFVRKRPDGVVRLVNPSVNKVLYESFRYSNMPEIVYDESDQPRARTCFMGGMHFVQVSQGLVNGDESVLKSVLLHEFSHCKHNHSFSRMVVCLGSSLFCSVLAAAFRDIAHGLPILLPLVALYFGANYGCFLLTECVADAESARQFKRGQPLKEHLLHHRETFTNKFRVSLLQIEGAR